MSFPGVLSLATRVKRSLPAPPLSLVKDAEDPSEAPPQSPPGRTKQLPPAAPHKEHSHWEAELGPWAALSLVPRSPQHRSHLGGGTGDASWVESLCTGDRHIPEYSLCSQSLSFALSRCGAVIVLFPQNSPTGSSHCSEQQNTAQPGGKQHREHSHCSPRPLELHGKVTTACEKYFGQRAEILNMPHSSSKSSVGTLEQNNNVNFGIFCWIKALYIQNFLLTFWQFLRCKI